MAAAIVPMAIEATIHSSAAPPTSDRVTGAASITSGTTFSPWSTNEARFRVTNSESISRRYCTGSGRSKP